MDARNSRAGARVARGFTLVELLVVIGIIAVLIGILLPVLGKARESANTVKCAANLRSVGQGLLLYVAENKGTFPAAYYYEGMQLSATSQTPDRAVEGYVHWSSFLYSDRNKIGNDTIFRGTSGWDAFTCPSLEKGGLPPTNTFPGNLDDGQANEDGGNVVDQQAPRLAYTVNEAICPKNKFVSGFQGAKRAYQYVRVSQVSKAAETILATEWNPNWRIVLDASRVDPSSNVSKSHRPIHGFVPLSGDAKAMENVAADPFGGRPTYRKGRMADLSPDPQPQAAVGTVLDWVGRNHGKKKGGVNTFDDRKSNFLYSDGHVETKNIRDTLEPFQWGERFWSLKSNGDIAPD